MSSGPCFAMELVGADAVRAWRNLIGPTNPSVAKTDAPGSLRALYGEDPTKNSFHGADSAESVIRVCVLYLTVSGFKLKDCQLSSLKALWLSFYFKSIF